jgi:ATP-dependent DNA helicase DinG
MGYVPRQAQRDLAMQIADVAAAGGILVAEAGTGTGKTYAYLVPALLQAGKVLISTGTKTLQDQLFHRDLPEVRKALGVSVVTALLKGRSNYVCHLHLERTVDEGRLASRQEVIWLRKIERFAKQSRSGDRADLAEVPETAPLWARVTSTRDNCLGNECPHIEHCFVMKARRNAAEADVVVVNHALFLADLALREEGITDLLPSADLIIFDEAHQLPQAATRFFAETLSLGQLLEFGRDALAATRQHSHESADWTAWVGAFEQACRDWRLACVEVDEAPGRRLPLEALRDGTAYDAGQAAVRETLARLAQGLGAVRERHADLERLVIRANELGERLERFDRQRTGTPRGDESANDPWVRWLEAGQGATAFRWHAAPLSVARQFSRHRRPGQAWVFTSATLSVQGDFTHFNRQLGLWEPRTGIWPSPFDYARQAMLLVPENLPEPADPGFHDAFMQVLLALVQANPGGTLVLCTTLRAVDRVAADLQEHLPGSRPVLRQGDLSRTELMTRFRDGERAVLVGSASFWEGIDFPGQLLTLVVIDKLPFAPPDDPVTEARIRRCREQGGNPFMEYQVPEAAIALKQGAGRLIRSQSDWGVLVVCDRRLISKPYGKLLWRGLPPFRRSRNPGDAVEFLRAGGPSPETPPGA